MHSKDLQEYIDRLKKYINDNKEYMKNPEVAMNEIIVERLKAQNYAYQKALDHVREIIARY